MKKNFKLIISIVLLLIVSVAVNAQQKSGVNKYEPGLTYNVGDLVVYNSIIYKAGVQTSNIPTTADWSETFVTTDTPQTISGAKSFSSNLVVTSTIEAVGGNSTQWNIAYGYDSRLTTLENQAITGVESYVTLALLQAEVGVTTKSYKVTNDAISSNNGYYHNTAPNTYIKDAELVKNTIDKTNVSDAVSGKSVFDFTKEETSTGNLFRNPKFRNPIPVNSINTSTEDISFFGGGYGVKKIMFGYPDAEKEYCVRIQSESTSLQTRKIAISSAWLKEKGFETGDKISIGFNAKFSDADGANTRTVYNYDDGAVAHSFPITNQNWNWIEFPEFEIMDINVSKEIYLSFRYVPITEFFKMTDLVIKNTTKSVWIGYEESLEWENRVEIKGVNLFTNPTKLDKDNILYNEVFEHNSYAFDKEITSLVGASISGEGMRYSNSSSQTLRLDLRLRNIKLTPKPYDRKFKIGFYIKTNNSNTSVRFYPMNEGASNLFSYENIPSGQEFWVESLTFTVPSNQTYLVDGVNEKIIIDSNTAAMNVFDVYGMTIAEVTQEIDFIYSDTFESFHRNEQINPFFGKKVCSYGDSIVAGNLWQGAVNDYLATTHYLRGIGGTTFADNGNTAYVDADGYYLNRPIVDGGTGVPQGVEGVDYFTINSELSHTERVGTIPLDTNLLFILGGRNDYGASIAIGTITDTTVSTVYGALNVMVTNIYARIPNAEIVILEPIYDSTESLTDYQAYRNAIKAIADRYNYLYISLSDCGINELNHATYLSDGTHPNQLGANKMSDYLIKKYNK